MKTPDEIKKGLEIAVNGCMTCDRCITECPYDLECHPTNEDTNVDLPKQMAADAIAYIQQLEHHIGELTEKVAQLEAAQPKWISVEERLPNVGEEVMVCGVKNGMQFGAFRGLLYPGKNRKWLWKKNTILEVTHWMPLPEAPKDEAYGTKGTAETES